MFRCIGLCPPRSLQLRWRTMLRGGSWFWMALPWWTDERHRSDLTSLTLVVTVTSRMSSVHDSSSLVEVWKIQVERMASLATVDFKAYHKLGRNADTTWEPLTMVYSLAFEACSTPSTFRNLRTTPSTLYLQLKTWWRSGCDDSWYVESFTNGEWHYCYCELMWPFILFALPGIVTQTLGSDLSPRSNSSSWSRCWDRVYWVSRSTLLTAQRAVEFKWLQGTVKATSSASIIPFVKVWDNADYAANVKSTVQTITRERICVVEWVETLDVFEPDCFTCL